MGGGGPVRRRVRLIWPAGINGAVYHDLHGRAEGRTRSYVFLQMGILALLAVFTGEATAGDGTAFAVVYSAFLFLLGWLWYSVRHRDDPAFRPSTTPYIAGVLVSATVVGASALLPDGARLAAWALVVVGWLGGIILLDWRSGATRDTSTNASASMIERFDLFTIIVLGEVVVGVVNGITEDGRSPIGVVTGMLGLGIGFAYWWSYFTSWELSPRRPGCTSCCWRSCWPPSGSSAYSHGSRSPTLMRRPRPRPARHTAVGRSWAVPRTPPTPRPALGPPRADDDQSVGHRLRDQHPALIDAHSTGSGMTVEVVE